MARLWTRVAAAAVLACAQDLPCVRTPAAYVERLDATGYQRLDRPGVAATGVNAAPPDDVSLTLDEGSISGHPLPLVVPTALHPLRIVLPQLLNETPLVTERLPHRTPVD